MHFWGRAIPFLDHGSHLSMLSYANLYNALKTYGSTTSLGILALPFHLLEARVWVITLLSQFPLGSSNSPFGKPQQKIRVRTDSEAGYFFLRFPLCEILVCVFQWKKVIAALKEANFKRLSLFCHLSSSRSGPVGGVAVASFDALVPFLCYVLLFPTGHHFKIDNFYIGFPWIFLIWFGHL